MAYTPNSNREIKNGKAVVSASELADFKKQYGSDMTLRDLLNADKGLERRGSKPNIPQVEPKVKNETTPEQVRSLARDTGTKLGRAKNSPSLASQGYTVGDRAHPEYPEDDIKQQERDIADKKFGAIDTGPKDSQYKRGGMTRSSASSRGDGIAQRGKTKGTMVACGGGYMKGKK